MKKMSSLCALSITTGIFCGLWAFISSPIGLLGWAGYAGCTSYFASGEHGLKGIKKSAIANMVGVLCGMGIILLSNWFPTLGTFGVWSGVFSFIICIIAKSEWFSFVPGTFLGCFTTFAIGGNWMLLVPSLLAGAILGVTCDKTGEWLYAMVSKDNSSSIEA